MIALSDPDHAGGRAQVGTETLIVFVATILVAAVAATLLLTTVGSLQSQAETASRDAGSQVTDQLLVLSATGTIDADASTRRVESISLLVMSAPGADEIDLSGATVEVVGPREQRAFSYTGDGTADAFAVRAVSDEDGTAPVLTDRSDRSVIRLPLNESGADAGLAPGDRATVRVVGPSGALQTRIVTVPESLRAAEDGDQIAL